MKKKDKPLGCFGSLVFVFFFQFLFVGLLIGLIYPSSPIAEGMTVMLQRFGEPWGASVWLMVYMISTFIAAVVAACFVELAIRIFIRIFHPNLAPSIRRKNTT
ncbi:hypothetical protein [Desmospora activa]|uniref:hypothetical protein n=1 Tax=Desmospora activa TaxID=500615 RepID=UPI000D2F5FE1|nr:hypothetical protein [Desmospora activa]